MYRNEANKNEEVGILFWRVREVSVLLEALFL